jgi:hypothetical protein
MLDNNCLSVDITWILGLHLLLSRPGPRSLAVGFEVPNQRFTVSTPCTTPTLSDELLKRSFFWRMNHGAILFSIITVSVPVRGASCKRRIDWGFVRSFATSSIFQIVAAE